MKKSKVMLFGAMALTAGLALAACGSSQSSNADKTYSYILSATLIPWITLPLHETLHLVSQPT